MALAWVLAVGGGELGVQESAREVDRRVQGETGRVLVDGGQEIRVQRERGAAVVDDAQAVERMVLRGHVLGAVRGPLGAGRALEVVEGPRCSQVRVLAFLLEVALQALFLAGAQARLLLGALLQLELLHAAATTVALDVRALVLAVRAAVVARRGRPALRLDHLQRLVGVRARRDAVPAYAALAGVLDAVDENHGVHTGSPRPLSSLLESLLSCYTLSVLQTGAPWSALSGKKPTKISCY